MIQLHIEFSFSFICLILYISLYFFGQVLLIEVRARARIAGSFVRMSSGGAPLLSRGHRLGSPEGVLSSRSIVRNYTTYQWPRRGANKGIGRECFLISSSTVWNGFCRIRRQIPRTYQKGHDIREGKHKYLYSVHISQHHLWHVLWNLKYVFVQKYLVWQEGGLWPWSEVPITRWQFQCRGVAEDKKCQRCQWYFQR